MSRRVLRYEGEGRTRKPIYDDGDGGASATGRADPMQAIGAMRLPGMPKDGVSTERRAVGQALVDARMKVDDQEPTARAVEEEPVTDIEGTTYAQIEVDAGPAQPGAADPGIPPASTELTQATVVAIALASLAVVAEEANAAWVRKSEATEVAIAADAAWAEAQAALGEAWAEVNEAMEGRWAEPAIPTPADDDHAHYILSVPIDPPTILEAALAAASESPEAEEVVEASVGEHSRLTHHQTNVLASTIKHDGDRRAVARELRMKHVQSVDVALDAIARKGLMPASLIPLLPARFAKYPGIPA